jgi:D-alanine-D-alanine ligase
MLEVNTVPGLSEQSILPKQAKHFGLSLAELFGNAIRVIL